MINKMFDIKYPIIQGAMANITTAEFAAAVSNAGALGIIATGAMDAETTRRAIRKCKSLTDKPFGVNVMLMNPHAKEIIDVTVREKVAMVTTGAGNPGVYIEKLKQAGIKIFPVVPTVSLAVRLRRAGVDGIIAEGTEAGGHVGESTTMSLLPQICDAVDIPVIAAGGIADGRGMAAAFALGAQGVQIGTRLLASVECPIHDNYKQAVINAKDNDTVVTGRSLNSPVRILKNQMSRRYVQLEKEAAGRDELEALTLGALRRAVLEGDITNGSVMMGQVAGMCKEILPLEQIFDTICRQAGLVMTAMGEKAVELNA